MEFYLTSTVWKHLTHQFEKGFFEPAKGPKISAESISKAVVNTSYRGYIGIAMLVAIVATPFLLMLDICHQVFKSLKDRVMDDMSILRFYQGEANNRGVTLEDICTNWDYDKLEQDHNYIQWLFPLLEKSPFNPSASVTNTKVITAFRKDPELQKKMLRSFEVMLDFYGFSLKPEGTIVKAAHFAERSKNWLTKGNHNFLRITRILTSLKLHGLEKYADNFFSVLKSIYRWDWNNTITKGTFDYWERALNLRINLFNKIANIQ